MTNQQTVIGVFADANQAQKAVDALQKAGYSDAHIDVMGRENITDPQMRQRRDEGVGGFFRSLFNDDDDDYQHLHDVARRGTVVTVHTNQMNSAERAADLLDSYGAVNSEEASTQLRERGVGFDDSETTLDVIKENLTVGKQTVATGGVRLQSRIINRPVEESIRLREENVFVTRTPVDREVNPDRIDRFQEGTVTMTETAEVPVVNKTARVVEQVSLGKQASEHTETIRENVRETEVNVERMAGTKATGATGYAANRVGNAANATGNAVKNTANSAHDALDRDNDGEVIDLNDNDGRIG